MKQVTLYTDGYCKPNPGRGGWAAILLFGKAEKELSGAEAKTTNNRMELTAAIKGLSALSEACQITIYTDSEYLRQGVTEWMEKWKTHGWKTTGKTAVKNRDLWVQIDELSQLHQISWHWVKGHSGNKYNERCDLLAALASTTLPPQ